MIINSIQASSIHLVPKKSFVQLLDNLPEHFKILKTFNSEFFN